MEWVNGVWEKRGEVVRGGLWNTNTLHKILFRVDIYRVSLRVGVI